MGINSDSASQFLSRASVFNIAVDPRPLTFTFFYRPKNVPFVDTLEVLFTNDGSAGPDIALIGKSDDTLNYYGAGNYATPAVSTFSGLVDEDLWYRFTVRLDDNDDFIISLDNDPDIASGTRVWSAGSGGTSRLGSYNGSLFGAQGDYAEFAAWSRLLSDAEITTHLYTAPETGKPASALSSGLLLYTPLLDTSNLGGWTNNGTTDSIAIGASPAHPNIVSGGLRPFFLTR